MTKKSLIKIWIVVIITYVMCFCDWSFAADNRDILWSISRLLYTLVNILSWFWVIFAKLAWEFLTNKWVYWEIIWLDKLLRQYRVVVRNIANFGLWFYFIYKVFLILIKKEWLTKDIQKVLLWILVAAVWIQSSRFVTAAMIDISTISLVAVWSLPAQITSKTPEIEEGFKKSLSDYIDQDFSLTTWLELRLFPQNWNFLENVYIPTERTKTKEEIIDALLPNAEDVSGPLYYIWFSLLNANLINSMDNSDENSLKKTLINVLIQWWTTIVYGIEMFVLCVLALMRIVYLWMFIILSPLAILLRCISKADKDLWNKIGWEKWFLASITKHINISSFMINIFKPAIVILWIWITMVFAVLMGGIINKNGDKSIKEDIWWIQITSYEDWNEQNRTYTTNIQSDLFSYTIRHVGKWLLDFIISIMTVIVIYFIIKMTINIWWWKDFVSTKIKKMQDSLGKLINSVPIIPVPWYDKQWVPTTRYINSNDIFGGSSSRGSIFDRVVGNLQGKVTDQYNEQNSIIDSWFNKDTKGYLTAYEMLQITNAKDNNDSINTLRLKKQAIDSMKSDKWKWMTLNLETASNDGYWIKEFENWLKYSKNKNITWTTNDRAWNLMITRWNDDDNKDKTLENMFQKDESNNVKAYADFFGLNLSQNTWEQLKNADISKK